MFPPLWILCREEFRTLGARDRSSTVRYLSFNLRLCVLHLWISFTRRSENLDLSRLAIDRRLFQRWWITSDSRVFHSVPRNYLIAVQLFRTARKSEKETGSPLSNGKRKRSISFAAKLHRASNREITKKRPPPRQRRFTTRFNGIFSNWFGQFTRDDGVFRKKAFRCLDVRDRNIPAKS